VINRRTVVVADFPLWTLLPFPLLVLALALLPSLVPNYWERPSVQLAVSLACASPVAAYELMNARSDLLVHALGGYATFVITLGALFTISGGVELSANLRATPKTNLLFLLTGALLASFVGTTGASMLLVRPFLKLNRERKERQHLVPFFILIVANVGGLLTPLGDPPLLLGYIDGVPFWWTLRLLPIWLLYVGSLSAAFYGYERRSFAAEPSSAESLAGSERERFALRGKRNLLLLAAVAPAALLPGGVREAVLIGLSAASYFTTERTIHRANSFGFAPLVELALIFFGLFSCLGPIEHTLAEVAPRLPVQRAWQLFWGSGLLSSVLDNAPTYAAFLALARGLTAHASALVAGVDPIRLAAISAGSVVMGASTYIGNGPNLLVKAIAERERYSLPSFARYALFAFTLMLPTHLLMSAALYWLEH
jgi:Na+/H+ antiporter NhaD/arsenite permease-like protein